MISMVRPGAQEQRSAKRVVCPRARADPPPQLLIPPPGPVSVFRGFCLFYSRLLQRCTRLPCRVLGNMWLGTSGLCLRFLSQRRSRCPPSGSAPGVHPRGEPPRRRCGARGAGGGPAAPSPHRRPGAGRGADGAARRRGRSAAETARSCWRAAGEFGSAARCRSGPMWIQLPSGCAFSAHLLVLSGRRNELLLGQGKERLPPPGPRRTSSLSRAGGYAENARSGL